MKLRVLACLIPMGFPACSPKPEPDPEPAPPQLSEEDKINFELPTITPLHNGNIVVRFKKSGCSVLFDREGKLLEGGRHCDDVDLYRARKAVKAYIAERQADKSGI